MMKKITVVSIVLLFGMGAFAKLTTSQQAEISSLCYKKSKSVKNYPQYCGCVQNNLRWLLDEDSWKDAKSIYTGDVTSADYGELDGRVEVDHMITEVELSCFKDSAYIAPKTKTEKEKDSK